MRIEAITPDRFPWFDYRRYTFSLGLSVNGRAYLSGHSASEYDPGERRIVVSGDLEHQTRTVYAKIGAILETAGYGFGDVVRLVEYVTVDGIDAYPQAESVRAATFGDGRPVVNTVAVNRLLRPEALIEIEVVAGRDGPAPEGAPGRPAWAAFRSLRDIVYLSSCLPVDDAGALAGERDLVSQAKQVYENAGRLLEAADLSWSNIVKTVDYLTPEAMAQYRTTGAIRRQYLGPVYPAATGVVMRRLAHPGALIQVDFLASPHQPAAVNPGWERYAKLTYNPAVRAGDVLFMSGQAALEPETERAVHAGDIVAQAEYTYTNVLKVLEAAGGSPGNMVKTIEYVTPEGLAAYRETAGVRRALFGEPYPASTGIVCDRLLRPEFELEVDPLAILA